MTVPSPMDDVRAQYEALPYPPRDPRDEAIRLVTGTPSHLLEVNHYLFSGRLNFARPFRTLAPPSMALDDRLAMAKRLIRFLPTTNLFRRNPYLNDHVTGGDAGLYDLLLHSCDRAFTVPEIGAMAVACGLRVVAFLEPVRYEPATYMSDPIIARQTSSLPLLERAAFAECLAGNLPSHVFYATPA